jgi:hypothetical protein
VFGLDLPMTDEKNLRMAGFLLALCLLAAGLMFWVIHIWD